MIEKENRTIGWRTTVPKLCAISPVMKGTTAPPEEPIDVMKERLLIWMFRGKSLEKMAVAQG